METIKEYERIILDEGPIPSKSGAGYLFEELKYGDKYDCICRSESRFDSKLPRSYKYPVTDNYVTWTIPKNHKIVMIGYIVTSLYTKDLRKSKREPVKCCWPVKSRGYSGYWQSGYLYRGHHSKTLRGLVEKVDRLRRDNIIRKMAARKERHAIRENAQKIWITEEKLKAIGACSIGIARGKELALKYLNITRPVGAIRADILLKIDREISIFVQHVIRKEIQR